MIELFLNLGMSEVLLILFVVLLLFGSKGLPNVARTLGKGIQEFKRASESIQKDVMNSTGEISHQVKREIEEVKKELEE
ncbi:MAG TPA: twin-arginine translocase TatA/TatE family subunit [Bacteroidia bacterium]|mgnify:CR=1 FL=1|jgi:sec-independent protein translocase protein TatA|nr:twin-arginine translocase TatA/TatE family subunit [Bacteroidia bacterium]